MIAARFARAGLSVIEVEDGDMALRLVFDVAAAVDAPVGVTIQEPAPTPLTVLSPCVGRFVRHHPLGGGAGEGTRVRAGEVVAFVAAGGLLHPATAPADGLIGAALVAEGAGVGYGVALIGFTPA